MLIQFCHRAFTELFHKGRKLEPSSSLPYSHFFNGSGKQRGTFGNLCLPLDAAAPANYSLRRGRVAILGPPKAGPTAVYRRSNIPRFARRVGATVSLALLALQFAQLSRAQAPGVYVVDPLASRIEIHLFKGGLLSSFGDNHVIVLTQFSGTAEALAGKSWEVRVVGESGSLKVMDPGASDSTRRQVQEKMLGPTQMDVTRYPTIELRSRSVLPGDADRSRRLLADLTLHGVTHPVEFHISWQQSGGQLRVSGKEQFLLREFKIEPARVAGGTIKVRNDFELVYDVRLERKP